MYYLMLTAAALLLGVDFALNKTYQKLRGTSPSASLFFNSILGLATAVIFFIMNKCTISFSPYSVIMAVLMSVLVMSYSIIGFRLLKSGSIAIYTLFLMTGGMVLPYIWGLLFLNEPFDIMRTAALIIIIIGVILSNFSGKGINTKQIIMCLSVFVLNGGVSIISKMHQIETNYNHVTSAEFIILGGIFKFLIAGVLWFIFKNKENEPVKKEFSKKGILIIIASAAVGGGSYLLQLYGAQALPATVLYPFITGGSIVFSALAGAVLFKEKLSQKIVISILLCFVGTIMFL